MAVQAGSPATTPIAPHVISGAFVQQYYHILHESPNQAHKFYQETSTVGRPNSNGVMEYVSTFSDINNMIMSMDFSSYLTKIETADAMLSHKDGVLIVVTGSLTSPESERRFTQSFFLAPQEAGGYFVLNDVFRFISDKSPVVINQVVNQENEGNQDGVLVAETEPTPAEEDLNSDHGAVENNVAEGEVLNSTIHDTTVENTTSVEPPVQVTKEDPKKTPVAPPPPPTAQRDVTKKSYASIVKVMNQGPPTPVVKSKPAPPKPVTKTVEGSEKPSVKHSQTVEITPSDRNVVESNSSHDEQGYSVFVKSLPSNVTVQVVEEEFKRFGPIKPGGIQVRNNKVDLFCFGFIEFESQQSMQAAIEASPIQMDGKDVIVEEKRTTTRVVNGVVITRGDNGNAARGGRYQSGRGVYRGENFRGRGGGYANNGNYRSGDNFNRRNDFRNRNEFSGRGRGPPPANEYEQNGNGFHPPRSYQNGNGNGKFARVNGPRQTPIAA